METKTKPKRAKVAGRVAGTPNKINATCKENILAVFNRLDGTAGMAKWAKANPSEFYKIYARLLPTQTEVSGPDGGDIPLSLNVTFR